MIDNIKTVPLEERIAALQAEVAKLRRVIIDLTQKRDWENYLMSAETEAVMRELYPFSRIADDDPTLFESQGA